VGEVDGMSHRPRKSYGPTIHRLVIPAVAFLLTIYITVRTTVGTISGRLEFGDTIYAFPVLAIVACKYLVDVLDWMREARADTKVRQAEHDRPDGPGMSGAQ